MLHTSGGGKRRGLGPRNDVLTTCKAVTLRDDQQIIAVFYKQEANRQRKSEMLKKIEIK